MKTETVKDKLISKAAAMEKIMAAAVKGYEEGMRSRELEQPDVLIRARWVKDGWCIEVDPHLAHSGFLRIENSLDVGLLRAVQMVKDNRRFRREHCGEEVPGRD